MPRRREVSVFAYLLVALSCSYCADASSLAAASPSLPADASRSNISSAKRHNATNKNSSESPILPPETLPSSATATSTLISQTSTGTSYESSGSLRSSILSQDDSTANHKHQGEVTPASSTMTESTTNTNSDAASVGIHGMKKKKSDPKRYNLDVQSSSFNPSYTSANSWVTVGTLKDPTGADFYTLAAALRSGATNIHLADGLHILDQTVVLDQTRAGLHIRGSSKERTIVKYTGKESMFVMFNTRNVAISNLQLDAKEANPPPADDTDIDPTNDASQEQQMWQVIGVVNSSGIGILDCIIHAPSTMHAVFFAGSFYASSRLYQPFFGDTSSRYEEGEKETVDAYRGGYLDENNTVRNNEIYSGFDGDALVFTFQRNGEVSGNRIVKGSISLYMNRDTACRSNTVMNAPTYGIHLTLPSDNVYIDANRIVQCGASAIRVARIDMDGVSGPMTHDIQQIIQPPPTVSTDERPQYRATGIQITSNRINDAQTVGIEVETTHGTLVTDNIISRTRLSAICLQHTDQAIVSANHLDDFGLGTADHGNHEHNGGIYGAMGVTGTVIENNMVTESLCHRSRYGIKIADVPENKDNDVSKNILSGKYETGEAISVGPDGTSAVRPDNILL